MDITNQDGLNNLPQADDIELVINLAAQAGVRYSLEHPFAYAHSNLNGHLSILEFCRHAKQKPRLIYASSSSVYGGNTKVPFSEEDAVNNPVSLYAATKRADELMSQTYAHFYGIHQIGLRFFTVYGTYGRPDMAYWLFTDKIVNDQPIKVFNNGKLRRDFTYVDDIVGGIMAMVKNYKAPSEGAPHTIYNIGNNKPVELFRFIEIVEEAVGKKANKVMMPMQPGDVKETYANIDKLKADYDFTPSTRLEDGIPRFVEWYKDFHNL